MVSVDEVKSLKGDEFLQVGMFAITREVVVMDVLGIPTKMYANDKYQILDPFGMIVFDGTSEDVAGFATGLTEGDLIEEDV